MTENPNPTTEPTEPTEPDRFQLPSLNDVPGYRRLNQTELDLLRDTKNMEIEVARLFHRILTADEVTNERMEGQDPTFRQADEGVLIEPTWLFEAQRSLSLGFSTLIRSFTRPYDPFNDDTLLQRQGDENNRKGDQKDG